MAGEEWVPHAEKEFGRFQHALSKHLPAKLTELRRHGRRMVALTATSNRKLKG